MAELHEWLNAQLAKVSRNHDVAKAINYMLRRWTAFTRFLDDGRVCITNNAAERALHGGEPAQRVAPRQHARLRGADRTAHRTALVDRHRHGVGRRVEHGSDV